MDIITTVQTRFSAQLLAGITIISLLLSAFPVAFFVAQAATSSLTMEVFANPPGSDADFEYISITNNGPDTVSLINFTLDEGGTELPFTLGGTLPSGNTIFACANGDFLTNGGRSCYETFPGGFDLVNSGGTVTLLDEFDATILSATWGDVSTESTAFSATASGVYPLPTACTPQVEDGLGSGPIENTDTNQFFTTIQNAIDDCDTDNGDTIEVAAGTYNEAVIIDKSIALLGPNHAIDGVTGTRLPEAVITEHLRTDVVDDVTVSGFEFSDIDSPNFTIYVIGESDGFTFKNNRFINNTKVAIKTPLTESSNDITIEGNLISGVTEAPQSGLFIGGITGESSISGNKIVDTAYGGIVISTADGLLISDNIIENVPQQGIQLATDIGDVTIQGNTITDANTDQVADKGAIRIYASDVVGPVLITNNTISGGHNGIAIKDGQDVAGKDIVITENDILAPNTGVQLYNGGTGEVDAEKNWWGIDTGIVTSSGSVDTEPWLCGPFASSPDESVAGACAVDTEKPVIAVNSPAAGAVFGSDFDVTVTATDDTALNRVVVNIKTATGGHIGTCLNDSAGGATSYTTSCTIDVDSLTEGTYNFRTNATDEAGNTSNTINQAFIVDKTGPVIVVDNPVDNLMTGAGFDIDVTATDDYGIAKVVINIKDEFGAHLGTCLNEVADGSSPYSTSCTVALTDWADGSYQFKTNALDLAGNISNTITQNFTINTNRPTIVVNMPTTVVTTDIDFDVNVTATDDAGIAQVVINIKDEFGAHLGTCLNEVADGSSPYTTSCTVDVDALTDGTYNFRTNARDMTGNLSNTINQQFIVDRTPTATVTMCKVDQNEVELADWALMLQGKPVGMYEVPANSPAGVNTDTVLAGVSHVVIADGTWDNNRGPLNIVDAEYSTEDNWMGSIMDGFTGFGTDILELFVGGTNGDWGPYNGSHQYAQSFVPAVDGPFNLAINDTNYSDNTGSLDVRVYEGFSGVTEDNGCVVFTDVPYGDYEVAEIMQAGFEPQSGLGPVTVDQEEMTFTVVNERLPEFGAYCGDGTVNQGWEACEADNETGMCNLATCQYENQCTELNLVKITLDETESPSFNDTVYLGSASNPIPSGVWFDFDVVGDASAGSIANNTQGLGVERDQTTQELYLAFAGGNRGGYLDTAIGTIEFMGAEVNAVGVDRTPNPQFKLENGSGSTFDDVFNVTSSTTIDFDLRADTGNDGVTVDLADVNICEAPLEMCHVPYLVTFSEDSDESTYSTTAGTGLVIEEIADGYTIGLYDDGRSGIYNVSGTIIFPAGTDTSSFAFSEGVGSDGLEQSNVLYPDVADRNDNVITFDLYVNGADDVFTITDESIDSVENCAVPVPTEPEPEPKPELYKLDGVKFEVEDGATTTGSGWTIYADNGIDTPLSTTTDENGYYYFDVPAGFWEVYEEDRPDWDLVEIDQYGMGYLTLELLESELSESSPESCSFMTGQLYFSIQTELLYSDDYSDVGPLGPIYQCDFYNQFTGTSDVSPEPEPPIGDDNNGTGGNGNTATYGSLMNQFATPSAQGLVAGITTDAPAYCPFLTDFMQIGEDNDTLEVLKLQAFLNIFRNMFGGTPNPVTGTFGEITDANVKALQETYRTEVLDPWYDAGLVSHNRPTGFVYLTTKWKINDILCPGEVPFPNLLNENQDSLTDID